MKWKNCHFNNFNIKSLSWLKILSLSFLLEMENPYT